MRPGHLRFLFTALLVCAACAPLAGCSNSSSSATTGATALDAGLVTGLQQVVAIGQSYGAVPSDPATQRAAGQIVLLTHDRNASLVAAAVLQSTESDPTFTGDKTMIETSRQASLMQAAKDLTQIQALQSSNVPGASALAGDGGAANVVNGIVAQQLAARAAAILASSAAPNPTDVATYLQEVSIVLGDQGNDGHDVAAQLAARALQTDAGLARVDAGVP